LFLFIQNKKYFPDIIDADISLYYKGSRATHWPPAMKAAAVPDG
jgi:hypothetical protein